LRIERNGSVELLLREEDADYDMVWRYRGHADGRPIEVASWPSDHEPHLGLAKGGWAYTLSTECADGALAVCSVSPEGHLSRVDTIEPSEWTFAVAGGSTTMAAVGRDLFQLDGSEGRSIGVSSPGEVDALAVDGIDRGVALVSGHLVRWSPRRGWRLLHRGGTLALRGELNVSHSARVSVMLAIARFGGHNQKVPCSTISPRIAGVFADERVPSPRRSIVASPRSSSTTAFSGTAPIIFGSPEPAHRS
jgi:hypothetical protein